MSASNELVSIIIPCYNQARFLGEAIESALQQIYPHFEVIVVDDGSKDHTSKVAAGYPEVVTISQANQGVSAARNTGVRASSGSYLVFLDSDDRLLPHALGIGMHHLLEHDECAFVFGRHREIAADGSVRPTSQAKVAEKDYYRRLLLSNCIFTHQRRCFGVRFLKV
jgi:glycosyltransferase involved in cell wall biosynthesis